MEGKGEGEPEDKMQFKLLNGMNNFGQFLFYMLISYNCIYCEITCEFKTNLIDID